MTTRFAVACAALLRTPAPMPLVDPDVITIAAATDITAFLRALTDPCLRDRSCFGRWIPAPGDAPDTHQLNAVDANGRAL